MVQYSVELVPLRKEPTLALSSKTNTYLEKWNLSSTAHLATTTTGQIYRVDYLGQPAVLKVLSPLGKRFEASSAQVLKCFSGNGSARVLMSDEDALLLEYIEGPHLKVIVHQGRDEKAADIIGDVLDRLHSYSGPPPLEVPELRQHFQSLFLRSKDKKSDPLFQRTAKVAEDLLATENHKRLLHGDIHHTNILNSLSRGWLAIDPQGVYGERTYDVANSFFNPDGMPETIETKRRIKSIAEIFSKRLKVEKQRVLRFAYAHGGLSSSWQLDEGEDPQRRLRITSVKESLL